MSGESHRVATAPRVIVSVIRTFRESVGRQAKHVTDITFQSTVVTVHVTCFVLSEHVGHGLYSSPNIIRVIKLRRMREVGHMVRMGDRIDAYRVLVGET